MPLPSVQPHEAPPSSLAQLAQLPVTLDCFRWKVITPDGVCEVPDYMDYIFQCNTNPETHVVCHRHKDTSRGTGNFHSSIAVCTKHSTPNNSASLATHSATLYSYYAHLAFLVMSYTYHCIPFTYLLAFSTGCFSAKMNFSG